MRQAAKKEGLLEFSIAFILLGPWLCSLIVSKLPIRVPALVLTALIVFSLMMMVLVLRQKVVIPKPSINNLLLGIFFILPLFALTNADISINLVKEKYVFLIYNVILFIVLLSLGRTMKPDAFSSLEYPLLIIARCLIVLFILFFIAGFHSWVNGRLVIDGTANTIWTARALGAGALVLLIFGSSRDLILLIPALGLILATGSKGPLIGLLIAYLVSKATRKSIFGFLGIGIFIFLMGMVFFSMFPEHRLFTDGYYSVFHRLVYYRQILSLEALPFGYGVGNYLYYFKGLNRIGYPHNIFLEVLFEFGYVGLLILIYMLVQVVRKAERGLLFYLFIFFFVNSNMSGDITGNATLILLMYIILNTKKYSYSPLKMRIAALSYG